MSKMVLPYALGKYDMSAFKQISFSTFYDINQTNTKFNQIIRKNFLPSIDITYELNKKRKEIEKRVQQSKKEYPIKLKQYNDLLLKYSKILVKGKLLEDEEYHALSWIFSSNGRQKAIEKHRERYSGIYKQIFSLKAEIDKLEPYNKEHWHTTQTLELAKLEADLKYKIEEDCHLWGEKKERELAPLRSKLYTLSQGFQCILQNLQISINHPETNILGRGYNIFGDGKLLLFKKTFINKSIEITK